MPKKSCTPGQGNFIIIEHANIDYPVLSNRRETLGKIITCYDVSSMTSPTTDEIKDHPKTDGEDSSDEYQVKEQFTWMLARETLERGTRESRWNPISHTDSSISRPTLLISVSSSTMVLRNQKYKRANTESFDCIGNRWSPCTLRSQTYLKTGTGYAWAGHCSVTPWTSAISNVRLLSIVENLGFAKPTGSTNQTSSQMQSLDSLIHTSYY